MIWLKGRIDKFGYLAYPVLLAIYPLLSFYQANLDELRSGEFSLKPFIILSFVALIVFWAVSRILLRDFRRASILAAMLIAMFFNFGRIQEHIKDFSLHLPIFTLGSVRLMILVCLIISLGAMWLLLRCKDNVVDGINYLFSIIALYLVLSTALLMIVSSIGGNKPEIVNSSEISSSGLGERSKFNKDNLPDIYYILLDGYGRQDILKSNFGFDNSDFINGLRDRGFYVADRSNSNYAHTHVSVPSTFNMKYLDYLSEQVGETSNNRKPLQDLLDHNSVVPIFKSMGYKYVNIGSQWGWTLDSPYSDISIRDSSGADKKILGIKLDEFALVYLQTTALKPFVSSTIKGTLLSRILSAFEKTKQVSEVDDATFSFTHILSPHPPYLFNRSGPIPGLSTELALANPGFSNRKGYIDQMVYVNKLTLDMIDSILSKSKTPPIIILDSDHGPASSLSTKDFSESDISKINKKGVQERMANLMTFYFPDKDYSRLYPTITPVNIFRIMLSQYFGQDLSKIEDKSYFSDNGANQYRFVDVTDLVAN